jgi:hypothetical protein
MKIGIVIVATNAYFPLGLRFINGWMRFYKGQHEIRFHLFTDRSPGEYLELQDGYEVIHHNVSHDRWVVAVNSKFANIASIDDDLDYIYFFDSDTKIYREFTDEWFIGEVVGGEHFGNNCWMKDAKDYDRNPASSSYVPIDTSLAQMYYLGAFFGGKKDKIKSICNILIEMQKKNKELKFEPRWNDESYLNCYFHYNPPTKVVLIRDFKFAISDKGGMSHTRNAKKDIEDLLSSIKANKKNVWDISNGEFKLVESRNNIA